MSFVYTKGAAKMLAGTIAFDADDIKAMLVDDLYGYDQHNDEFVADIASHRVGTDVLLSGVDVSGGFLDANDANWTGLPTGPYVQAVVIYKDTGNPATSPLLFYIDAITGLPLEMTGADRTVQWDNGGYGIYSLIA